MKIGNKARAALGNSEQGEELAQALDALEAQVNTLAQIVAQGAEPVTLETAAENGNTIDPVQV